MLLGPDGKPIKKDKKGQVVDGIQGQIAAEEQKEFAELTLHCMKTFYKVQQCGKTNHDNIWARRRFKGGYVLMFDIYQGMAFCPDPELVPCTKKESYRRGAQAFAGLIKQWVVGALDPPHILRLLIPAQQRKVMAVTGRMPTKEKGAQTLLKESFEQRANLRKQGFDPEKEGLK